jgi:hypothetical protein
MLVASLPVVSLPVVSCQAGPGPRARTASRAFLRCPTAAAAAVETHPAGDPPTVVPHHLRIRRTGSHRWSTANPALGRGTTRARPPRPSGPTSRRQPARRAHLHRRTEERPRAGPPHRRPGPGWRLAGRREACFDRATSGLAGRRRRRQTGRRPRRVVLRPSSRDTGQPGPRRSLIPRPVRAGATRSEPRPGTIGFRAPAMRAASIRTRPTRRWRRSPAGQHRQAWCLPRGRPERRR